MKEDIDSLNNFFKKQKKLILILFIAIIFFIISLFILLTPHISLKGKRLMRIEVNSEYKEKGAKAYKGFKEIKGIIIKDNIDTSKIGEYEVKYTIKYKNKKYTKKRKVIVEDTIPPVITLNGGMETKICSKGKYEDESATAIDNYDGDITKKIKVTKKENSIIYSVKDSSGNKTNIERKLIVSDKTAPVITLNGDSYTYLYIGDEYIDAGAGAIDNCDGDLTKKIKTAGVNDVNNNELGEYTISYEVEDSKGNKSSLERIVKVIERPKNDKVIYLTFDDGPSYTITSSVLDILKEENVKATFFVINHSDDLNYLIKREFDEGHTVALHSFSHNYGTIYQSVDAYFDDLNAIKNKVKNITGVDSNIIRFPGGSSNTVSNFNPGIMTTLASEVGNRGYIYFDWNVSSGDAGGASSASEVYYSVINDLNSKTNVVLMHDFESNYKTLNALRDIIVYAKNNGYTFDRITESTPKIRHGINN